MALSKEQFLELRNKGLTVEQITSFEQGGQPSEALKTSYTPLGTSKGASIKSGLAKWGYKTLRNISSISEKGIRFPTDIIKGKSAKESFSAPTSAEGIQTMIEKKKGLAPGALLEPANPIEKATMSSMDVVSLFIPILPKGAGLATKGKAAKLAVGASKEAVEFGTKVGVQTEDPKQAGTASLFGAGGVVFGKLLEVGLPKISKILEKSTLRLTTNQKQNMAKQIEGASEYLNKNKIVGTPQQRLAKIRLKYNETEDILQSWLKKGEAAGTTVNKKTLIEQLKAISKKYENVGKVVDINVLEKQIAERIKNLERLPDEIPTWMLNNTKRQVYNNAYNKAGNKVLDYVEKDIGDVLRINIENSTGGLLIEGKAIEVFNKEYGNIINAKTLLKTAASRRQSGILGRIIAWSMGGAIARGAQAGEVGAVVGSTLAVTISDTLFGTLPKTLLAAGLDRKNLAIIESTLRKLITPLLTKDK